MSLLKEKENLLDNPNIKKLNYDQYLNKLRETQPEAEYNPSVDYFTQAVRHGMMEEYFEEDTQEIFYELTDDKLRKIDSELKLKYGYSEVQQPSLNQPTLESWSKG